MEPRPAHCAATEPASGHPALITVHRAHADITPFMITVASIRARRCARYTPCIHPPPPSSKRPENTNTLYQFMNLMPDTNKCSVNMLPVLFEEHKCAGRQGCIALLFLKYYGITARGRSLGDADSRVHFTLTHSHCDCVICARYHQYR